MICKEQQTTSTFFDEYCRHYSDFSKLLCIYVRNFYPEIGFEYEQLLDASYNVWQRLNDDEKLALASFLEEISQESSQALSSSANTETWNNLINCELLATKLKYSPKRNGSKIVSKKNSSENRCMSKTKKTVVKKRMPISPFHIYLKDERQNFLKKHKNMSMNEINKRLSARWKRMSNRMKGTYEYRSYLAKKRFYKNQGKARSLGKPSLGA